MLWYGTDINGHKPVCTRFILFTSSMYRLCTCMYHYILGIKCMFSGTYFRQKVCAQYILTGWAGAQGRRKVAPREGARGAAKSRGRTFAKPTILLVQFWALVLPLWFRTRVSPHGDYNANRWTKLSSWKGIKNYELIPIWMNSSLCSRDVSAVAECVWVWVS